MIRHPSDNLVIHNAKCVPAAVPATVTKTWELLVYSPLVFSCKQLFKLNLYDDRVVIGPSAPVDGVSGVPGRLG